MNTVSVVISRKALLGFAVAAIFVTAFVVWLSAKDRYQVLALDDGAVVYDRTEELVCFVYASGRARCKSINLAKTEGRK